MMDPEESAELKAAIDQLGTAMGARDYSKEIFIRTYVAATAYGHAESVCKDLAFGALETFETPLR